MSIFLSITCCMSIPCKWVMTDGTIFADQEIVGSAWQQERWLFFKYSDKWQLSCYSSLYLKLTSMLAFLSSSCKKKKTQLCMHIKPCASIWVDEWLHPWLLRLKYKSRWTLQGRLGLFWIWGITVTIAYWGVKLKMVQRCLVALTTGWHYLHNQHLLCRKKSL